MSRPERILPSNTEAEKCILGSLLLDGSRFASITGAITEEKFALEKHRRIWARMSDLAERGEAIDRVTVANELLRRNELESIDGLSYLVSLDDGLPHISNLDSYVRIIIEKYRLRRAIMAAQRTMTQAFSGEFTADQICLDGQAMLAEETGGYGGSNIESAAEFVASYPGGINLFLNPSQANPGIPTGFHAIDELTDGFHAGEIHVVGARPSHGKTAYGACVAKNVARAGHAVAVFTAELSKSMWTHRVVCEEAHVSYSRFRRGEIDDEERARLRQATQLVMDMPLYIDDSSGLRIADIRVQVNRILRNRPVSLMVVDYAQLLRPPKGQRFGTENDKFTAIGEEIKTLTKQTGIPMLLLSQLNRDSEKDKGDSRPKLSQCRGAGIWEEIAFVGATLYREYLRKRERDDLREVADFLIEKNRSGPVGSPRLRFQPWLMRFSSQESDIPHAATPPATRDPSASSGEQAVMEIPEHEQAE